MANLENQVNKLVEELVVFEPASIALTGSSAKGEATEKGDVELAVVFNDQNYKSRSELSRYSTEQIRVYPFKKAEVEKLESKVPFPQKFYFWWVKHNSRTLHGEEILENLEVKLSDADLWRVVEFERGVTLSAMLSLRHGDQETADWAFSKSCLFATAAQLHLRGTQVSTYQDIVQRGTQAFPEFAELIKTASAVRQGAAHVKPDNIFENFEYLHQMILTE